MMEKPCHTVVKMLLGQPRYSTEYCRIYTRINHIYAYLRPEYDLGHLPKAQPVPAGILGPKILIGVHIVDEEAKLR
jgi:hypothetical protein